MGSKARDKQGETLLLKKLAWLETVRMGKVGGGRHV
jgi:hypothetical protein